MGLGIMLGLIMTIMNPIGGVLLAVGFALMFHRVKKMLALKKEDPENYASNVKKEKNYNVLIGVVMITSGFVVLEPKKENTTNKHNASQKQTINYTIIGKRDYSFAGRKRLGVFVYAPEAVTSLERASVVKRAAFELQKETGADFTDAILEIADFSYGEGNVLAMADYAADGCGTSGNRCTGNKWNIESSDVKVSALQINVLREWEELKHKYQGKKGYLDLEDEKPLIRAISKKLNIKIEEVNLPNVAGTMKKINIENL